MTERGAGGELIPVDGLSTCHCRRLVRFCISGNFSESVQNALLAQVKLFANSGATAHEIVTHLVDPN